MAFANATVSDIIATTIQHRNGVLADDLTNNNALLRTLKKRGNVRPFSGGNVILEELMYNDPNTNNADSYSGYQLINISPDSPITSTPSVSAASRIFSSGTITPKSIIW